ncbi:MAG: NOP5/NOP56 family protein [Thermoplasmata archaeon]
MHIKTTWFGVFITDKGKVVKYKLFKKNPDKIAENLLEISEGRILREERVLASEFSGLTTSDPRIARLGIPYSPDECEIHPENYGFTPEIQRSALLSLSRLKLRRGSEDIQITQRVKCIEMLNRLENMLFEVLWDWYAHYFPELEGKVAQEKMVELIFEYGDREVISRALGIELPSLGADFTKQDLNDVKELAGLLISIRKVRGNINNTLEHLMKDYAPALSETAGPIIGAKLIERKGGLRELAVLPSSTIQILGAEKAFFRYLRKRGKMPKHGIIFQHPSIMHANKTQRGKLARALAAKIAIAARKDAFGKVLKEQDE